MPKHLYIGTRKGLFTFELQGTRWQQVRHDFHGVGVTSVLADPRDGSLFAGLEHGHFGPKLHRSRDGGASWQEITCPAYPPQPEGEVDLCPMRGTPIPWKVQKMWVLEAGGADQPGWLWCGTLPGGLFRSTDAGDSWELVRSLWDDPRRKQWIGGGADVPGIHSICVDPRNSKHVYLGVSCGGVWESFNAGETWDCQGKGIRADYAPPEFAYTPHTQDVHRVVLCGGDSQTMWVQHHNGIFNSRDGGANWNELQNVQPSCFGFAVAVHPHEPETAWFVPGVKDEVRIPVDGQFVVTRTRDGGRTFETLRNGLPTGPAYDLVYRHGLDIHAGDCSLAVGSTTGSLWVSHDLGDSWHTLSNHLPPIYCVRFGT